MIDYTPLWETMKEKGISTYTLINTYKMDKHLIHRLKHNESITMNTLESLCKILECTPEKIVRFTD